MVVGRSNAVRVESGIARKLHAGRRKRILGRVGVRCPKRRKEASHPPLDFAPRQEGFIANSVVQRKVAAGLPAVLNVGALKLAARIEKLSRRLIELVQIAEEKAGHGVAGDISVEVELSRLLKEVVDVHL